MNNLTFKIFVTIAHALLMPALTLSEFSFPNDKSLVQHNSLYSAPQIELYNNNNDDLSPEGKHMHKAKKLKKKIRRLCLLTGGKIERSAIVEGKFFYPTVVQQTAVSVNGGAGGHDHQNDDPHSGAAAGIDCSNLLHSGVFDHHHPLLGILGSGGDTNRYYHENFQRQVIRPLYKSMKVIYRLF